MSIPAGILLVVMIDPTMARALAAQHAAELEAGFATPGPARDGVGSPGPLAVRAGRAFVTLGWRIGGAAALAPTVRRRLA